MASAIPKGSIVRLRVSMALCFHITDQLMEVGYRVRGTTHHFSKAQSLDAL